MLLREFLSEGRAISVPFRWGTSTIDIPVIENPSADQAGVLFRKTIRSPYVKTAAYSTGGGYLRGLCYRGEKTYIWDGWNATHDDVQHCLFPDVPSHSSDITLFEVNGLGEVNVTRQGDHWFTPENNRYCAAITRGVARAMLTEAMGPEFYFVATCVMGGHGDGGEAIHDMTDKATEISFAQFTKAVGREQLKDHFPEYEWNPRGRGLKMKDDYAMQDAYYRSEWYGIPLRVLRAISCRVYLHTQWRDSRIHGNRP